jgi:hypothetical protein
MNGLTGLIGSGSRRPKWLRFSPALTTLTGVVSDPVNAVAPNATVKLKDAQSGSLRDTKTNAEGYYTFASVPVGTYELTVELSSFEKYEVEGLEIGGGEKRNVNVILKVGSTSETV